MIRDAVIHMQGEQPLMADLPELPSAGSVCLVCTNLRTVDGKRPVFIDRGDHTFVIPLNHIRFIEIADQAPRPDADQHPEEDEVLQLPAGEDAELALDEDFLRRVREV